MRKRISPNQGMEKVLIARDRVAAERINQILSVAGFDVRRTAMGIAVDRAMRVVSSIYKLKNCTLSSGFKGLCALYTNIIL